MCFHVNKVTGISYQNQNTKYNTSIKIEGTEYLSILVIKYHTIETCRKWRHCFTYYTICATGSFTSHLDPTVITILTALCHFPLILIDIFPLDDCVDYTLRPLYVASLRVIKVYSIHLH
jgi:hypothetical protein